MPVKCVPRRTGKKPGRKTVRVGPHRRSTPKKLPRVCR